MQSGQKPGLLFVLLLSVLVCGRTVFAATPKTVLLLVSGVSLSDYSPQSLLPKYQELSRQGAVALMNLSVTSEPTEAAIYLTIGGGIPLTVPDKTGPRIEEAGIDRTLADVAQDAFRADTREGVVVCRTYRRRFDEYPPLRARIIHVGVPALRKVQLTPADAEQIGQFGQVMRRAGKRISVFGDWCGVLVAMDKRAAVYGGALRPLEESEIRKTLRYCDLLICHEPHPRRALSLASAFLRHSQTEPLNLLILCLPPKIDPQENDPHGLLMGIGPAFPQNSLLGGKQEGRARLVDIAPLLAALSGTTFSDGVGQPLVSKRALGDAWAHLGGANFALASLWQYLPLLIIAALLLLAVCIGVLLYRLNQLRR